MSQSAKDREAEAVVRSAIVHLIGEKAIDHVEVRPTEDQAGEPGLAVTIFLKAPRERMSGSLLLDAIAAAASALREIDDFRFPYVTFLAPEYESGRGYGPSPKVLYVVSSGISSKTLACLRRRQAAAHGRLRCGARCRQPITPCFRRSARCAPTHWSDRASLGKRSPRSFERWNTVGRAHLLQLSATTAQLQRFGLAFKELQEAREWADYNPEPRPSFEEGKKGSALHPRRSAYPD